MASITSVGVAQLPPSISNLTVPQLKAICKERKIPGYSKLGKAALLQKLAESGGGKAHTSSASDASTTENASATSEKRGCADTLPQSASAAETSTAESARQLVKESKPRVKKSKLRPSATEATAVTAMPTGQAMLLLKSSPQYPFNVPSLQPSAYLPFNEDASDPAPTINHLETETQDRATTLLVPLVKTGTSRPSTGLVTSLQASVVGTKRASNTLEAPARKKQKTLQGKSFMKVPAPRTSTFKTPTLPAKTVASPLDCASSSTSSATVPLTSRTSAKTPAVSDDVHRISQTSTLRNAPAAPARKRFKPLIIVKPSPKAPVSEYTPAGSVTAPRSDVASMPSAQLEVPKEDRNVAPALYYLDLPPPPSITSLMLITLPPSLAQRKRVQRWAIILSGLSDEERRRCALVSRTFRYAVYLSATHILQWRFSGARFTQDVVRRYSQAMTNMWPYFRVRQLEVQQRRQAYRDSFLARFFQTRGLPGPIADHLWASPDCERQVVIALRFVMSRLWFAVSLGGPDDEKSTAWLRGTVTGAQEVVTGEIWSITVSASCAPSSHSRREEVFYVLQATCEVVGHPISRLASDHTAEPDRTSMSLRADWSGYIQQRLAPQPDNATLRPLLSHLKWANCEEYERGISRLWLSRVAREGALGAAKRVVAERYVLACVVGNSVSGQWMTAMEMAQDFAGLPARTHTGRAGGQAPPVHLYLPEHHHVESVHFSASNGRPMHGALAVVQTPHREYYILRDNGMQVGCEEDGVPPVWQEVLQCDRLGF